MAEAVTHIEEAKKILDFDSEIKLINTTTEEIHSVTFREFMNEYAKGWNYLAFAKAFTAGNVVQEINWNNEGQYDAAVLVNLPIQWCEGECSSDSVTFHADYQTPYETCVTKHHFHCGYCNKIVQVG